MSSTILPSIQEMFPDHLMNKENRRSTRPSKSATATSSHDSSVCRVPGCDCATPSSSAERSRCASPHSSDRTHAYSGSAAGSSISSSVPVELRNSIANDDRPSEHSRSNSSSASTVDHRHYTSSSKTTNDFPYSQSNTPSRSPSRRHSDDSRTGAREDDLSHRDDRQRVYAPDSRVITHANDLQYRSRSRSPPYGSRSQVAYPYPPYPASSGRSYPGQYPPTRHQTEDDELDGDEYDDPLSSALGNHTNNPNSTRKHVCPTCFKRFNRPSSLKIHVNTHTGATPFRCPWPNCGREFNVNSNMRRHYRNHLTPSRGQGIFPLPPPPPHASSPPTQVPALVPATPVPTHGSSAPHSRNTHPHQPYGPSTGSFYPPAPHQNPNGPKAEGTPAYRPRSHTYSLSAGSDVYYGHHDQYSRSGGLDRGRERSSPHLANEVYSHGSHMRYSRNDIEAHRPASSPGTSYRYPTPSSSSRSTVPSPPMTHSSASDAGNSDMDMDVDTDGARHRHSHFSRSKPSHSHSPKFRFLDRHHPYEHPAVSRHRPPPLPLDQHSMEIDAASAYPTPTSKHSIDGVDVDSVTRRPLSPAGSSFRSSSPSPSITNSSNRSQSRSLSRERHNDEQPSPKYNPSKPYASDALSGAHVSTTLRPAFV